MGGNQQSDLQDLLKMPLGGQCAPTKSTGWEQATNAFFPLLHAGGVSPPQASCYRSSSSLCRKPVVLGGRGAKQFRNGGGDQKGQNMGVTPRDTPGARGDLRRKTATAAPQPNTQHAWDIQGVMHGDFDCHACIGLLSRRGMSVMLGYNHAWVQLLSCMSGSVCC